MYYVKSCRKAKSDTLPLYKAERSALKVTPQCDGATWLKRPVWKLHFGVASWKWLRMIHALMPPIKSLGRTTPGVARVSQCELSSYVVGFEVYRSD